MRSFTSMTSIPVALMLCTCAAIMSAPAGAVDIPMQAAPAAAPAKADHMAMAREAIKAKDFRKSLAELMLAVKEQPGNADAHNLLGYSYRKQASPDLPKAFEHYLLALKIDPRHKGAHEYIGEAYLMDKQPAKAEEHLAQIKAICGNNTCEEYEDLAKSIAQYKTGNKTN